MAVGIRADYANVLPSALACFEDDFEGLHRAPAPAGHASSLRKDDELLERLFVRERRRLKIIPNGFGEKSGLKLMFGALIRAAERWRGLRFTQFELRQIAAVRKDLDDEYQTSITPLARSAQPHVSSKSKPCLRQGRLELQAARDCASGRRPLERLKDRRHVRSRYDRCAHTYFSAICVAAAVVCRA